MNLIDNGMKSFKKFNTDHINVLRIVWFGFLIISLISSFASVSAWSNTTFNNSLSTENLTFTGSQNITRYLSVPQNIYLTNARMNLSGFNSSSSVVNGRIAANTCYASVGAGGANVSCNSDSDTINTNDGDFSTFETFSPFVDPYLKNYTGLGNLSSANFTIKAQSFNDGSTVPQGIRTYYYNYTNNTYVLLGNLSCPAALCNDLETETYIIPSDGLRDTISFQIITEETANQRLYETMLNWTAILYPSNVNISINNNQFHLISGSLQQQNNRTNNFALSINNYLTSCTYISGFCQVPIQFHSDTAGILRYLDMNFSSEGVLESSVNWSNSSYETKNETFYINITYDPALYASVTSNLIYDNRTYAGSYNGLFYRKIDLPLVSTLTNKSYYWQFRLVSAIDGSAYQLNSSIYNQSVSPIYFGNCNASLVQNTVNYTIYDEDTLLPINVSSFGSTFYYWLGDGTVKENSSFNLTTFASSYKFCINQSITLNVNPTISLTKSNYFSRTYSFINERFNSTNIERSLYMLNNSLGTNIILEWKDAGLSPIIADLMKIRRYYPSTNSYLDVHQDLTDNFGVVVGSLIENTVKYKFEFYNSSNSLLQTSEPVTIACRSSICVISFVKEDTTNDFNRFENITNYEYTLIFNNDTNNFIYTWNDNTGSLPFHRLLVEKIAYNGTTIVCNSSSTDIIGSLTCGVSGDGSYRAQIYRHASPERRIDLLNIKVGAPRDFGIEGLLWSFILTMTMIGVGVWNPPIGIGLYVVTMIFLGSIGIIYVSPAIIIAEIALGVAFIWAFRS